MASPDGNQHSATPPPRSPLRKAGLVVVTALAVWVAVVSSYRIISSTIFAKPGKSELSCREGTRELYESVERARTKTAALAKPEREALAIFRKEVEPVWRQMEGVRSACQSDKDTQALQTLRSVTLLRYAEERAVRYQAIDLTRWRKEAPEQVNALDVH